MQKTRVVAVGKYFSLLACLAFMAITLSSCSSSGSYNISGTVTGLSGSGLVLQNNGGDDLTLDENGDFTFVATLDNNSAYNVTITNQPITPSQTCIVTNGNGTITAADITDVTVSCVDDIAPSVSTSSPANDETGVERNAVISATFNEDMLTATLDNNSFTLNDGNNTEGTVNFDALSNQVTFTPSSEMALLRNYTASLNSDITDLSGNSLAAQSWDFTTRDGAWSTEALIHSDDTWNAVVPEIAMDAEGNATAVWLQYDTPKLRSVWSNRYTKGAGWGTAERIENDDLDALRPRIAMDQNGNALAIWQQDDGTRFNTWSNRYTAGNSWGTAELIENAAFELSWNPEIAISANGDALAAWSKSDGERYKIWFNRYTNDSGWGTAELIVTNSTESTAAIDVAINANGDAIAVWMQYDGTNQNIWSSRFTTDSGWDKAELIETDDAGSALHPKITIDANGNALVLWYQSDGTYYNIWFNRYTQSGGWGTASLIESENAGHAMYPQIAVDANGNALAVWHQNDGIHYNTWSNRYKTDTGWGTATLIENDNTGDAFKSQIAMDINGNALAVWYQSDGTNNNIWSNRYTLGSGWDIATLIENKSAGDAKYPKIAIDANGNALAVWHQSNGTNTNIMSNRFE